jgi:hypothetical protein
LQRPLNNDILFPNTLSSDIAGPLAVQFRAPPSQPVSMLSSATPTPTTQTTGQPGLIGYVRFDFAFTSSQTWESDDILPNHA